MYLPGPSDIKNGRSSTSMGNGALLGLHTGLDETIEHGESAGIAQDSVDTWLQEQNQMREYLEKKDNDHGIRSTCAMGIFSGRINSAFVAASDIHNKRMLWSKRNEERERCSRNAKSKRWSNSKR